MKLKSCACLVCMLMIPSLSFAGTIVKNIFNSGDTISSSKMNANFAALESATKGALSNIVRTLRDKSSDKYLASAYTSDVLSLTCNNDELMVGATCSCNSSGFNSSTTNFGVLAACDMAGNGVVGACYSYWDASPSKYGSPLRLTAACIKGATVSSTLSATVMASKSLDEPQEPDQDLLDEIERAKNILREREIDR